MIRTARTARPIPFAQDAEEAAIGAALSYTAAVEVFIESLAPNEFYVPSHQAIANIIHLLYSNGEAVDAMTVGTELDRLGLHEHKDGLFRLAGNPASTSSLPTYVAQVKRAAAGRQAIGLADEASEQIANGGDPYEVTERLTIDLADLDRLGMVPPGLITYDALLDAPETPDEIIVPGLLYRDTRVVIVATEGGGKSTLWRQCAWCMAAGIHPFAFEEKIRAVKVLLLDLENPIRELRKTGKLLRYRVDQFASHRDPKNLYVFRRMEGMDLSKKRVRRDLEAVLSAVRPDVVVGGPVYKMGPQYDVREVDALQEIWLHFMVRYRFAVMLEHHAPIGKDAKGKRDWRAMGGQRWQGWPDCSIGLELSDDKNVFTVTRSRPDRGDFDWPVEFHRGKVWPWEPHWMAY